MRTAIFHLSALLIVFVIVFATPCSAEVVTTVSLGGGYQGNLFNDSLSIGESYSSIGGDIKLYPSNSVQITGEGTYNAFSSTKDLSNFLGGTSVMFIPTSETSALSVMFTGQLSYRGFGILYELYNRSSAGASGAFGYRLLTSLQIQSRVSYSGTNYLKSDYGSNRGFEVAGGFNLTPYGSNSLAFEVGYSRFTYDLAKYEESGNSNSSQRVTTNSQAYTSTGLSLRYSRPLGERTGISMSFGHRLSQLDDALAITGYSIDYLSPWGELWDGSSISANVKHFFPGQVTVEINGAIYDKAFVDVIESDSLLAESFLLKSRQDDLATTSITISKAITVGENNLLTPGLNLGYTHSQSTLDEYDYGDISAYFSVKMRF